MNKTRPQHCEKCPFSWGSTVGGRGNPEASIVFVGESPGANELAKNEPFIGPSGKVLMDAFPEGITEDDYYMLNALQCMPPKPRDKTKALDFLQEGCHACHDRLVAEIQKHPRKVVVTLGNGALWSLTGDYHLKVTANRGRLIKSPLAEEGIVVSVHPAYLLHGGGVYQKFKADIDYAWKLNSEGNVARKRHIIPTWNVAECDEDVIDFFMYMAQQATETNDRYAGADIETGGFNFIRDEILAWGICISPDEVFIIPEDFLPAARKYLPILEAAGIRYVWHNGKFDCKFLNHERYNIPVRVDEDTMLLNYSMDEVRGQHDLEQVGSDLLGAPLYKAMLKPWLPNSRTSYRVIPKPILYEYLARDVSDTKQIYRILKKKNEADALSKKLYNGVLLPASELLQRVEENGIQVDLEQVYKNDLKLGQEMDLYKQQMNDICVGLGQNPINPNSPIQVGNILYKVLRLAVTNKGTGEDILEGLPQHPFVVALRKYRKVAKAWGTYVKPLIKEIGGKENKKYIVYSDGKVHSTYLIHGTATGRLSSREPNMQNQPRLPYIRGQYVAGKDRIIMECDIDQAELRSLAERSNDPVLIDIYTTPGKSIHKEVSIDLWGEDWLRKYKIDTPGDTEYDEAKEQYMRTKALNFGIVYGREAPSIAEEFDVSIAEAQKWIDGWGIKFPDAWKFIEKCRLAPVRNQNLVTPFGRRKRCQVVSYEKLKDLQNEASNFPHQSIASDITLVSACKVWKRLHNYGVKIINLIHDAILMEMPNDPELMKWVAQYVTEEMMKTPVEWGITRVPFLADAKIGDRWGNLTGFEFK